jgi:hypothetical protein
VESWNDGGGQSCQKPKLFNYEIRKICERDRNPVKTEDWNGGIAENWNDDSDQSCQKPKPFNYEMRERRERDQNPVKKIGMLE